MDPFSVRVAANAIRTVTAVDAEPDVEDAQVWLIQC